MSSQRRVLIAGATGLVGDRLLARLAEHPGYRTVTTVGRRAPDRTGEQLNHLIVDFNDEPLALPASDVFFCCLGTTRAKAGSDEAFRAVDLHLVVRLARGARAAGADTIIVVSSVGANAKSSNMYLRTKGEMEQAIQALDYTRCGIIRPSILYGDRNETRIGESIGKIAGRVLQPLMIGGLARYRGVDADTAAAAMLQLDQSGFDSTKVLIGADIPRVAGQ